MDGGWIRPARHRLHFDRRIRRSSGPTEEMMRRLLSISALMFGVLTMGLTIGLLIQRQGSSPPEVVLVTAQRSPESGMRVYGVARQAEREVWFPLGRAYDGLSTWGVSPDGQWLYLLGYRQVGPDYEYVTLRLRLDGLHIEPLPNIDLLSGLFWTADGQWMVYKGVDEMTGGTALFRATPDGKIVQNLTPTIRASPVIDVPTPPIISPENDWVAFNGFEFHNEIYVANAGVVTQITRGSYPTYLRGHVRNQTGDWLIVSKVDGAYRVRLDGSELTRLLPNEPIVADIVYFWPEARLILIQRDKAEDILYAVSMEDFSVQWSMPEFFLATSQPHQPYRIAIKERLHQVFPDGTLRRIEFLPNSSAIHFSADGTTVYFAHYGPPSATSLMTGILYGIRFADGQLQTLHTSNYSLDFVRWSSDDGWFLIETDDHPGQDIWRIWEATGRSELLVSKRRYDRFLGVGRVDDRDLAGLPLIGGGGLLVVGALYQIRRKVHPIPNSSP
ncbi:MAG: hypothetical protein K8L91_04060, partial [Anaerolineae bacterium]|nr:hypothetical protein [Anaerolineae bacterium]